MVEDIKRLVGEEDGIRHIYKLLCHHCLERNIMDTGLSLLWSLSVEGVCVCVCVYVCHACNYVLLCVFVYVSVHH